MERVYNSAPRTVRAAALRIGACAAGNDLLRQFRHVRDGNEPQEPRVQIPDSSREEKCARMAAEKIRSCCRLFLFQIHPKRKRRLDFAKDFT